MSRARTDIKGQKEEKGLVCKNCLQSGKNIAVFKNLCDGVPVMVKKIIDDIGGRTEETDLGHKLWAVRVLDGNDSGHIFVFLHKVWVHGCFSDQKAGEELPRGQPQRARKNSDRQDTKRRAPRQEKRR